MEVSLFGVTLYLLFVQITSFNTDTLRFGVLKSEKNHSFFGYSITATVTNKSISIWSGSPKYSESPHLKSSAKSGAIYKCSLDSSRTGGCEKITFKSENNTDHREEDSKLVALPPCAFLNSTCGFRPDNVTLWHTKESYDKINDASKKRNLIMKNNRPVKCYVKIGYKRLTGPPSYTVHGGFLGVDSDALLENAKRSDKEVSTVMTSRSLKAKNGDAMCLRFCFHAYSAVDLALPTKYRTNRSLEVWMEYDDSTSKKLFYYEGPQQTVSNFWNYTEIDVVHERDGQYQLKFKVTVANFKYRRIMHECTIASDIIINDINVDNSACSEEHEHLEKYESEQSIGISLDGKRNEDNSSTILTCGPLLQKDCGYAKEAIGICYELKISENGTQTTEKLDPLSKGCIKGKIDVVLLVDQSGSVNQCNFQKVKQWLRNIIRGFTIGPEEQDIAVVVYSSKDRTRNVFELGFSEYGNSGERKKKQMLTGLKTLPFQAGTTYTGLAFQHANELLWGPNGRNDARKMIILLTDGATTKKNKGVLTKQVEISKERNATILAVGVAGYDANELIDISGDPRNFFPVRDFSELENVRNTLRETVSYGNLEGSQAHASASESMQNCQLGFSLHYGNRSLLMGSPGCYGRSGDVIKNQKFKPMAQKEREIDDTQPHDEDVSNITSLTSERKEFEDGLSNQENHTSVVPNKTRIDISNKNSFIIPTLDELEHAFSRHMEDGYFGYAVSSGYFRGEEMGEFIAASAPRLNGTGLVLVYQSESANSVLRSQVLHGSQLGAYFGAVLSAEDVNMDGFTDLFVGCPLYSSINPDEGRVYVYMGGKNLSSEPAIVLEGSGNLFSRFGSAITSVGDLTLDGFTDMVVSSPHEEDGRGAIYVFHGSKNGIIAKYAQRIAASSLNSDIPFLMFGQSIAGGIDVDENGYPDILVGAPGSDAVVILKTRAVLHVDAELSIRTAFIDRRDSTCWRQNSTLNKNFDEACTMCTVCFTYYGKSTPWELALHYDVTADTKHLESRVEFYESYDRILHGSTVVRGANVTTCKNHTLYLKKHILDMMSAVYIELRYDLEDVFHGLQENKTDLLPILDIYTPRHTVSTTRFKTYCDDTSSCVADISVQNSVLVNEMGESADNVTMDEEGIIRVKAEVSNFEGPEDAHAVSLKIHYPETLTLNSIKNTNCLKELDRKKSRDDLQTIVELVLSSTLLPNGESCSGILIFLASRSLRRNVKERISMMIRGTTISHDKNPGFDNEKEIEVPLLYKGKFKLNGESHPLAVTNVISNSSNVTHQGSIYFQHVYTVINVGLVGLKNISLNLNMSNCLNSIPINFTEYSICESHLYERKCPEENKQVRSLNESNPSICKNNGKGGSSMLLTNEFMTLKTFIEDLAVHESAKIVLYGSVQEVLLKNQQETLSLQTELSLEFGQKRSLVFPSDQTYSAMVFTHVIPQMEQTEPTIAQKFFTLPLWVYIVSALAGLLVLIILLFGLRLAGFFNSKYAEKKKEAQEDMLFSSERAPMNVET